MDKRIFSITCTTCQARLVVRSEAAIGAILECPRCDSMVQVTPPPGWQPAAPPLQTPTTPVGPPPLDCVATVPLSLELEPAGTSLLATLVSPTWLVLGGAVLTLLVVFSGLWWLLPPRSVPEPVARDCPNFRVSENGTVPFAATAPAGAAEAASHAATTPEPQSGSVAPESNSPSPRPSSEEPTPTASIQSQPTDAKPVEPDPFLAIADEPADDAVQIEIKKAPPTQVDVAARLADPIAKIELTDMSLVKAVELLAAMGNLPVTIDADALMQLGVAPGDPISLKLDLTSVGKALRAVVSQKGLAVTLENGRVLVRSPAEYRETLRKVRYTVADLTGDDETAVAELAALVRKLVAPESWQGTGGRGTIEPEKAVLVVQQTGEIHGQILVFCEKLRTARHKPLRSRDNPERFVLTTRWAQAREMLAQPVSVNFHEPTPLAKVLAFLGEAAHLDILIDHAALATAETSDRVESTLTATNQELGTALDDLLRPLGLTYRTVGGHAIQVTTKEAADERLELEFYPVGPWLVKQDSQPSLAGGPSKKNSPRPLAGEGQQRLSPLPLGEGQGVRGLALAERLKARIAASTWSDVGGPAEIYFDPASECLIVLQSQAAQAAIETRAEGGGRKAD